MKYEERFLSYPSTFDIPCLKLDILVPSISATPDIRRPYQ
jgi:hypothetical protein